jgi:hypothetical protein
MGIKASSLSDKADMWEPRHQACRIRQIRGNQGIKLVEYCGYDKTRQDKTRQDETRRDKTRQDETRRNKTRQDKTRQDETRQDIYESSHISAYHMIGH